MAQQSVSQIIDDGNQRRQPAVIQTAPSAIVPVQLRPLKNRKSPKCLGYIQSLVGFICSVTGIFTSIFGNQIFVIVFSLGTICGAWFIFTGILGSSVSQRNSKCLKILSIVMNIIAFSVAVGAVSFAAVKFSIFPTHTGNEIAPFIIIVDCCAFEMVAAIVHIALTIASCCDRSMPKEAVAVVGAAGSPVFNQGVPTPNISYPAFENRGYMPQD